MKLHPPGRKHPVQVRELFDLDIAIPVPELLPCLFAHISSVCLSQMVPIHPRLRKYTQKTHCYKDFHFRVTHLSSTGG